MMKRCLLIFPCLLLTIQGAVAQRVVCQKEDSLKVTGLLASAPRDKTTGEYMTYFGNRLRGVPYVARTLERDTSEKLVVNLRELDCTTFVENALALSLCMKYGKRTFPDFAEFLRLIRYKGGDIAYENRLHYFTSWIQENTRNGFVSECGQDSAASDLFAKVQRLDINYMTRHVSQYPALSRDSSLIMKIGETERGLTGLEFRYIPKGLLDKHSKLKDVVRSGDIIVILTNREGLDCSHIGIASWHSDGTLHLLNASQLRGKVVDEPMTLYTYMQKHPSQTGIRVVRVD